MSDTNDYVEPREAAVEEDPENRVGEYVWLKKTVQAGHRRRKYFFDEGKKAYDYVAGDQWSSDDKIILQEQNRPAVVFNRTAPIIKAVCGLEVNNRQEIAYLPREQGDVGPDESRTAMARWVRDETNAEDEESEAFRDLAICGEGWTETAMSYDTKPQGKIQELRIDPLEMGTDKDACRVNYTDARLLYRVREMSAADAQELFDDKYAAEDLHAGWLDDTGMPADGGQGIKPDYPDKTRPAVRNASGRATQVRVVQVQWWQHEPLYLVAEEGSDELKEMSEPEHTTYTQRVGALQQRDAKAAQDHATAVEGYAADPSLAGLGVPPPVAPQPIAPQYKSAKVKKRCYYEAFVGTRVFEKRKIDMDDFQFKCMTGERDRANKCFYGMLRDMFDPQMWANKWLSQTMHILNTNAKGGIMAETDAFMNTRKAEKDWADNTKIVWVKPGSLSNNKIKERSPPPLPQGLGELMQFALASLRDVTGVNLELLGQADREQAASLESQRRQSAMTILAKLFDSLRRYRKDQGRLLLHFIDMLPEGTLYRVLEQGRWKYVPLVKDRKATEYDVIFDQAPTSPDQKQATWLMTMQLVSGGIPLPPAALMKLLKYSPYPESVVQELSDAMGLGSEMPPELMKQKLDQAEQALKVLEEQLQKAMAEKSSAEDERDIKLLETRIEDYRAETERLKVKVDALSKEGDRQASVASSAAKASVAATSAQGAGSSVPDASAGGELTRGGGQGGGYGGNEEIVARLDTLGEMVERLMNALTPQQPTPQEGLNNAPTE